MVLLGLGLRSNAWSGRILERCEGIWTRLPPCHPTQLSRWMLTVDDSPTPSPPVSDSTLWLPQRIKLVTNSDTDVDSHIITSIDSASTPSFLKLQTPQHPPT